MDYVLSTVIILSILVFVSFSVWYKTSYVYIISSIDGKSYKVKNNHLAQQCADSLAEINKRLLKLISYIEGLKNPPRYYERLKKYNPENLSENILNMDTTYTVNKSSMYFCLTPRDEDIYVYDINTLMFVAIHELAHVCSISIGHTREFKDNFKNLIEHSIFLNIYEYVDYSKSPIDYCGINITSNVI